MSDIISSFSCQLGGNQLGPMSHDNIFDNNVQIKVMRIKGYELETRSGES